MGEIESTFRESCTIEVLNFSSFRKLYLSFQKPVSYLRAFAVYDLLSSYTLETKFPLSMYAYRTNRMDLSSFSWGSSSVNLNLYRARCQGISPNQNALSRDFSESEDVVKRFHPIRMRCQEIFPYQNNFSKDFSHSKCVVKGFHPIKICCQEISPNLSAWYLEFSWRTVRKQNLLVIV